MKLVIFLEKDVTDEAQAQQLFDIVKTKLSEYPEVKIQGSVSNTLPLED